MYRKSKKDIVKKCALAIAAVLAFAASSFAQSSDTYAITVPSACSLTVTTNPLLVTSKACTPVVIKCGAPDFNCSPTSTAVAVTPPLPSLPTVNSTGYAYKNPGDFFYPLSGIGNCYTALTDINTRNGRSFSASWSGGASNFMSDINREFLAATDGNNLFYFHVHYDSAGCMFRDSNLVNSLSGGAGGGGFTFARNTPAQAIRLSAMNGDGTKTGLYQENLTYSGGVMGITRKKLFDFNNAPGVDGTLTTQGGNGNVGISDDDRYISTTLNFPPALGGQNNAHWVFSWDSQTNKSTTWYTGVVKNLENPANGNIWTWCSNDPSDPVTHGNCSRHGFNPAPTYLNTTCDPTLGFGIHGNQVAHNGVYIDVSGPCNGVGDSINLWEYGTNNIQVCNAKTNCGGHDAVGWNTVRTTDFTYASHPLNNITSYTTILPHSPVGMDEHGSINWKGIAADVNPHMMETQPNFGKTCTTVPYCFELDAVKISGTVVRFGPTFHQWVPAGDLGPIAVMTQDGFCMIFASTWNNTRGVDAQGNPRKDLFSLCRTQ